MRPLGICHKSFFATLQIELLDNKTWDTRRELTQAIFEWIEAFYNSERRHSSLEYDSPTDYQHRHTPAQAVA